MSPYITSHLSAAVEDAATAIRTAIGDRTDHIDVGERFWLLHNSIDELVIALDQAPLDERQYCRRLIRTVVSALETPQARKRSMTPDIQSVCARINERLIQLEWLTSPSQAVAVER